MNFKILQEVSHYSVYRYALIALLFLPLLFLDNRASHDWGDDFAQYIHQAKNIVQGKPQAETGFVYSQENYIGPTAYPSGFPLLLAPVYALFGNSIKAFTVYISLFYFILALIALSFYRKHFSAAGALVLTIILIYNPQFILFKEEVMSDIPFTVFLLIAFLVYPKVKRDDYRGIFLFGFLAGFLVMIRSVGAVLLVAIAIDQVLEMVRQRKRAKLLNEEKIPFYKLIDFPLLLFGIPVIVYFLFNSFIFRIPSGGSLHDYLLFYYSGDFISTIPANLEQYVEVFRFAYTPAVGAFRFIALITGAVILTMTLFGMIAKFSSRMGVTDIFFILYVFILLVFPNNYSAYRLLIPVGFLLLYYAALGFKSLKVRYIQRSKVKIWTLGVIMVLLFLPGIIRITLGRNTTLDGPQQKASQQAFTFIAEQIPDTSVIVFFKPRALVLYTGKHGFADPFTDDPTSVHTQLTQASADYILIHRDYTRETMKRYLRMLKSRALPVWENRKFKLYRIIPPNPSERY